MKKQIIVHVNPFNIKHHVIEYAIRLARRLDLPLLLYSVQEFSVMPVAMETGGQVLSTQELPPDWEQTVKDKAEAYCKEIQRVYPNTTFEHEIGMLSDSIKNKLSHLYTSASARNPYLLVMPKENEYNWFTDLIGTAETAVASDAPCPVLFVPDETPLEDVDRILYLADRESLENYQYPGFGFLNALSTNLNAKITVALLAGEIAEKPYFSIPAAMEKLRMSLPNQEDHEFHFFADFSAEQILNMARLTKMDIVAFPFREAGLLERFSDNEVTRTLVLKADVPTLVF